MLGELDLSVYRSTESYTKQIAVSYNGVQLIAEELSQMFVTDSHRQLGLLDCGDIKTYVFNPDDNPISTDLYCTFSPYENKCSLALQRDDFAQILAHCNFTFNEPELATRAKDGILIMNDNKPLTIREYGQNKKLKDTIPNRTSVFIATEYQLSIKTGGIDLIFEPVFNVSSRKIIYSYLTSEFINHMKWSTNARSLLTAIGVNEGLIKGILIVLAFLVPITLTMCGCYINSSQLCSIIRSSRATTIIKKVGTAKQNYQENKKFLRNLRNSK